MDKSRKKMLWTVFAVVVLVAGVVWIAASPRPDHMEDTNGADNYSLQTITERDVVEMKMGVRGSVNTRESHVEIAGMNISSGTEYSSKKFTGVHRLYTSTIFKGSDIYVNLFDFTVNEGNFAFYIVFDGEIIGQVEPNETGSSEFTLNNIEKTGSLEYIIAGESANFSFIPVAGFE